MGFIGRAGEPRFVAKDVCDVLGIANSRDAVASLDDDEKGVATTDTLGGRQDMTTINESGLYSLIIRSRKPDAQAMTGRLDELSKIKSPELGGLSQSFGNNDVTIINESGLYNAIIGSKKPDAKAFKKWITSEVLPSIRKHGVYATDGFIERTLSDPDYAIAMLTAFKHRSK